MHKTTAAAAAGAVALTATGAVSALFLTLSQPSSGQFAEPAPTTTVITEYVDQHGNPVAAPDGTGLNLPRVVVVEAPAAEPGVIEEVSYVTTYTQADSVAPQYEEGDEFEEDDDYEEDEDEEAYEDHDGYKEDEDDA